MHEIVKVNGKEAHPIFDYLTSHSKGFLGSSVKWNFTKFLVNRNGEVVGATPQQISQVALRTIFKRF